MILRSTITFEPPFKARSRKLGPVLKAAHDAGARFWHREMLPGHFTHGAKGRYGYAQRDWKRRVRKRTRGKPYLVVSGVTKERTTATIRVQAYPTRATLTLYAPSYVHQRPRRPNMPDMAREIFAVRSDEQKRIEAVEQQTAEKMLRDMKETKTVRIG